MSGTRQDLVSLVAEDLLLRVLAGEWTIPTAMRTDTILQSAEALGPKDDWDWFIQDRLPHVKRNFVRDVRVRFTEHPDIARQRLAVVKETQAALDRARKAVEANRDRPAVVTKVVESVEEPGMIEIALLLEPDNLARFFGAMEEYFGL